MKNPERPINKAAPEDPIPGYFELSDWPVPVKPPFRLVEIVIFRCGELRSTVCIYLKDANHQKLPFFFDSFLGRLCFGEENHRTDSAAYITSNSKLEREAFAAIEDALQRCQPGYIYNASELSILRECLERAKVYTGSSDIVPNMG